MALKVIAALVVDGDKAEARRACATEACARGHGGVDHPEALQGLQGELLCSTRITSCGSAIEQVEADLVEVQRGGGGGGGRRRARRRSRGR
jgi:hypothetical protein